MISLFLNTINNFLLSLIIVANINSSYICDNENLFLTIRNNINGDFIEIEDISVVKPGAFVNLNWKNKNLMLPYSPRNGSISFSDKKWDWRYRLNNQGIINLSEPILYELLSSEKYIEHSCKINPN
tara:strand:+ start:6132 stop:6509 length:378 start_codon:yes stop_codon:yes gene_type:complete